MNKTSPVPPVLRAIYVLLCAIMFSACGGGGGGGGDDVSSVVGVSAGGGGTPGVTLAGGGADGPVVGGDIHIYDRDGDSCGEPVVTQPNSQYSIFLPIFGCETPWKIVLSGGDDLVTGEVNYTTMYSLGVDMSVVPLNINVSPLTTIIYYAALANTSSGNSLAEVDDEGVNVDLISRAVMRKFNFGMGGDDSDFAPLTSEIGDANAKSFVKGNEGLIETVRRTAWQFRGAVDGVAIDDVLLALGGDMADGLLNGLVRPGVSSVGGTHLAMLWELNTAAVAMELMMNQLDITLEGGSLLAASSISALSAAATAVSGTPVSDSDMENVVINALFVQQAKEAAAAASALAGDVGEFADFLQALTVMEAELSGSSVVSSAFAQQALAPLVNPSLAVAEADALALDMLTGGASSGDVDNALVAAAPVSKVSSPVYEERRTVMVEWDYPAGLLEQGGFRLYRQQGDVSQLVCYVNNPDARNTSGYESECAIVASPGDKVSLYLTAFDSARAVESSPSLVYENYLPVAEFVTDETFVQCPYTFTFDASRSSAFYPAGLQFDWLFDDGAQDVGLSPDHAFSYPALYSVLLTATAVDPSGVFSVSTQSSLDVSCL